MLGWGPIFVNFFVSCSCIRFRFFCTVSLLHVYERSWACLGGVGPAQARAHVSDSRFLCTVLLLHVYERSCVCLGRVEPTHLSTIGFHIDSRAAPIEHGHEVEQRARIKGEEGKKEDGGSRKEEGGMRKQEGWHDSRFRFERICFLVY